MDYVIVSDTTALAGPGYAFREVGALARGTVVRSMEKRDGWYRLESGTPATQYWVEEELTLPATTALPADFGQLGREPSRAAPRATTGEVTWSWGPRIAGTLQVVGGALEVALGVGGVAVPTGVTTVGGIILIAHGSDTIIAGFRTLWSGEIQHSLTQTTATAAAEKLGASSETAQRIGIGADLAAGVGPSIAVGVSRRLALAVAEKASPRIAVAYLHRGALQMGHNAVGVKTGATTAWVHFAGVPNGAVQSMASGPSSRYIITELMVNGQQAARALKAQEALMRAGMQSWSYFGPNCTTTALQVLRQGGVVVPAWSVSPGLLHMGVRAGPEITFMAGTIGSTTPDLMPRTSIGGR